ncbi:hypothetical protein OLNG_00239 [Ostreococcus lucimarinus virus OlV5]|jgi:hypothetical protein|uniref:hypothetical protein n=1 Tax=Ostreococcus lucimarinus virus OlV5 TaxID=754064 RepID=UPI0002C0654A|nr:hypothetical protein OLNG_00239 [Ostreococcus lucimarinus virus OlV5]AGH31308.1 hypothetical protein OLNG_00239 [Ostreococcus lucimarinus virus OlV5]|tara:strand:+ start:45 stop:368 length:324 start_codon:yes stop_codon:yes gene_type:complete
MIVDVQCEDETIQIANLIRDENTHDVEVRFLKRIKSNLYDFDNEISVVPKESVCGWYDCENLEDTELYVKVSGGYDLVDDSEDEDFTCSESDEPDSESESLIDEDEA